MAPSPVDGNTVEVSEFLLHACHDLRTGLRAIRAHSELLLKDRDGEKGPSLEERVAFIADGASRIDQLTDGLSSYAIALQIQEQAFQPAPLGVLLRTAMAKLNQELRANDAHVTYADLPRVSGDADRLMEVFHNLLHNALQYRGPAAPVIEIQAQEQAEGWLLTVRDNGPGIETAYLESIFRPFVRLHGKGRPGLGLTICRVIVERHGGRIWAESQAGGGSAFCFTLPAA